MTNSNVFEFYCLWVLALITSIVLCVHAFFAIPHIIGLVLVYCAAVCYFGTMIWFLRMGLECTRYTKMGFKGPAEVPLTPKESDPKEVDMFEYVNKQNQDKLLKEVGHWLVDSAMILKNSHHLYQNDELLAPIPTYITKKFWAWMSNNFTRWAFRVCILGALAFLSYSILGLLPLGMLFVFCWAISVFLFAFGLMKTL